MAAIIHIFGFAFISHYLINDIGSSVTRKIYVHPAAILLLPIKHDIVTINNYPATAIARASQHAQHDNTWWCGVARSKRQQRLVAAEPSKQLT
jgi:hypothetical protein